MSFPKHKPATLDERRSGAREDLYKDNFNLNGERENWEGIAEAQGRKRESTLSSEQVAEKILARLYERLRVANGSTDHIEPHTGRQAKVDPKITKNLVRKLVHETRGIKSTELRDAIAGQVSEIRQGFKNA